MDPVTQRTQELQELFKKTGQDLFLQTIAKIIIAQEREIERLSRVVESCEENFELMSRAMNIAEKKLAEHFEIVEDTDDDGERQ
jgi:archaellum component FlaC